MIKPKNNYIEITLVDNTLTDNALDLSKTFTKGYSQRSKLIVPNEGIDKKGRRIWFYNYGVYIVNGKCLLPKDNIIATQIKKDMPIILDNRGILVKSIPIPQSLNSFVARTQNWFQVVKSLYPLFDEKFCGHTIAENDIIIIIPETAYKLNIDGQKYYFIDKKNIMLHLNPGINPGPDFKMLKQFKSKGGIFELPYSDRGLNENEEVEFFNPLKRIAEITIKNDIYYIVQKEGIYGI